MFQVRTRQDLGKTGVEDMIKLTDLNEASLLWNLRHDDDDDDDWKMYTK